MTLRCIVICIWELGFRGLRDAGHGFSLCTMGEQALQFHNLLLSSFSLLAITHCCFCLSLVHCSFLFVLVLSIFGFQLSTTIFLFESSCVNFLYVFIIYEAPKLSTSLFECF
jgi:hypothetical protein